MYAESMGQEASRRRHLIFLAHVWACSPFFFLWWQDPYYRVGIPPDQMGRISTFFPLIGVYLVVRTLLAWRPPAKLNWEYVFPPIDVLIISSLIWMGNRNPLSNISMLYFIPLAEASGTLSLRWAISVAGMVLFGAGWATNWFQVVGLDAFNAQFRYVFIFIMASLLTSLAIAASKDRERESVARDRNRIAMEMHDGVQGHLMTIASQLELAQHMVERSPERATAIVRESRDSARLAADELRYLVQRMRAPTLAQGFVPAVHQYVHNIASRAGIAFTFESEGDAYELRGGLENALFRILQESLNNVLRHSEATRVQVLLRYEPLEVSLCVTDDGKGFQPALGDKTGRHAGLDGMNQRASELGGSFDVRSESGAGTVVIVRLPTKEPD